MITGLNISTLQSALIKSFSRASKLLLRHYVYKEDCAEEFLKRERQYDFFLRKFVGICLKGKEMTKNIIRNPLDENTCDYCKAKEGTEIVLLSEANEIPYYEDCMNEDGCRCYVALEVQ